MFSIRLNFFISLDRQANWHRYSGSGRILKIFALTQIGRQTTDYDDDAGDETTYIKMVKRG